MEICKQCPFNLSGPSSRLHRRLWIYIVSGETKLCFGALPPRDDGRLWFGIRKIKECQGSETRNFLKFLQPPSVGEGGATPNRAQRLLLALLRDQSWQWPGDSGCPRDGTGVDYVQFSSGLLPRP